MEILFKGVIAAIVIIDIICIVIELYQYYDNFSYDELQKVNINLMSLPPKSNLLSKNISLLELIMKI